MIIIKRLFGKIKSFQLQINSIQTTLDSMKSNKMFTTRTEENSLLLSQRNKKSASYSDFQQQQHHQTDSGTITEMKLRFAQIAEMLQQNIELHKIAEDENEQSILQECQDNLILIEENAKKLALDSIFSHPDHVLFENSCILEITPGVGGADAYDFVNMLCRIYTEWAISQHFKCIIIDEDIDDTGGSRSTTMKIIGKHAFGLLSAEAGVHRLVRISPFDPSHKRHTSFAQVIVYPMINHEHESLFKIDLKSNDFKIDTFKSSGPGGQHVNSTDSAVRITHIPTRTVVKCQNERSQLRNRETAALIMASKLRQIQADVIEKETRMSSIGADQGGDSWGHQIRSIVLHPYTLVKDHRSKWESKQTDAFLEGRQLGEAIEAALLWKYGFHSLIPSDD